MTANKMPEMPEAAGWKEGGSYTTAQMRDYGRACYLAGIAAARECVPAEIVERLGGIEWGWEGAENVGHNDCRETTLTNLSAMEGEAGAAVVAVDSDGDMVIESPAPLPVGTKLYTAPPPQQAASDEDAAEKYRAAWQAGRDAQKAEQAATQPQQAGRSARRGR